MLVARCGNGRARTSALRFEHRDQQCFADPAYNLQIPSPFPIALDANDNLFAAKFSTTSSELDEFEPPYASTPSVTNTLGTGARDLGITVDSSGTVYVANRTGSVSIYASPYTAAPTMVTVGLSDAEGWP